MTLALLFKVLKVLHEWYHYLNIKIDKPKVDIKNKYKVDVFTTFYPGEPKKMLYETLHAIKNINYPHVSYLCDEANDPELKEFCIENGIHHVTRNNRKDAKAGNINNALKQANGEIALILDPDHVPHPLLLDRVLPYFDDEQVGFVQAVPAYYNPEASLVSKGAAQQTYQLYGPMMITMSNYGTAQAFGSNGCFRRKALDTIGGHAAGLAEDMHTSMQLHAKGWKSVYVPEVLTKGQVPEDINAYYKQQLKWSKGVMDLLLYVFPKLVANFTWRQKLHYFLLPLYYMYGLVNLIDITIPILALTTSLIPWKIDFFEFFRLITPFIIFSLLIRHYVQKWVLDENERGSHFLGGILRNGTWWIFLLGIFYSVFRIKLLYLPTPKEKSKKSLSVYGLPNLFFAIICLLAFFYGLYIDLNPYSLFMAVFALINAMVLFFSYLLVFDKFNEKRQFSEEDEFASKKNYIHILKRELWLSRHGVYALIRRYAMFFGILTAMTSIIFFIYNKREKEVATTLKTQEFIIAFPGDTTFTKRNMLQYQDVRLDVEFNSIDDSLKYEGNVFINLEKEDLLSHDQFFDRILNGDYDVFFKSNLIDRIACHSNTIFITWLLNQPLELPSHQTDRVRIEEKQYRAWKHISSFLDNSVCYDAVKVWPVSSCNLPPKHFTDQLANIDWLAYDYEKIPMNKGLLDNIARLPVMVYNIEPEIADILISENKTHTINGMIFHDEIPKSLIEKFQYKKPDNLLFASSQPAGFIKKSKEAKDNVIQHQLNQPLKGVVYHPVYFENEKPIILNRIQLDKDFELIKKMGANVIRVYDPGIYIHNIHRMATKYELNIIISFYNNPRIDYAIDAKARNREFKYLQQRLNIYSRYKRVIGFCYGDETLGDLKDHFAKPYVKSVQQSYFDLLVQVSALQSEIAPEKLSIFNINLSDHFLTEINDYDLHHFDLVGLNAFYEAHFELAKDWIQEPGNPHKILYTSLGVDGFWHKKYARQLHYDLYDELSDTEKAVQYVSRWNNYVKGLEEKVIGACFYKWNDAPYGSLTWFGITNQQSERKLAYHAIQTLFNEKEVSNLNVPEIKIVYNGQRFFPHSEPSFLAVIDGDLKNDQYQISWKLHRENTRGEIEHIREIGEGNYVKLPVLYKSGRYRVYLEARDGENNVFTASKPMVEF
ncbi:MAG: glycosyltransferase [Cyclobacteriaceae bacterium]|nr:glycosyltransferase [Cyclobacteriaceae bacterium]